MFNTTAYYQPAVHASETSLTAFDIICTDTMELYQEGRYPTISEGFEPLTPSKGRMSIQSVSAEQTIYNGLYNAVPNIDVTSYGLTKTQVSEMMQDIMNTSPELFYVDKGYSISYNSNEIVSTIIPTYIVTGTTLQEQKAFYQTSLNTILNQIDSSWSDLEKIVFTHDYLCQNYEYDATYSIYDTYNFFKEGKGVCQSYTLTFLAVMKELGIEASVASSTQMTPNHIWNVVQLNGHWYHLDITWDDPLNSASDDKLGLAFHNNLLLSDTAIATCRGSSSSYHYGWSSNYTCTDTTYDSYFWEDSKSPFQYLDGTWYYTYYDETSKNGTLATYDFDTAKTQSVTDLGKWYVNGSNSYYPGCYSGLDIYNGSLYYHTYSSIYAYHPSDKTTTTIYKPDKSGVLYGMKIDGQILSYYDAATPNDAGIIYTYELETVEPTPLPIVSTQPTASPAVTMEPSVEPTSSPVVTAEPSVEPTSSPIASPQPSTEGSSEPDITPTPTADISVTPSIKPSADSTPTASATTVLTSTLPPVTSSPPFPPRDTNVTSHAPAPTASNILSGDVDFDKNVSLSDAQVTLKAALKITMLNEQESLAADVDENGTIELQDAQLILKYALKIISSFKTSRILSISIDQVLYSGLSNCASSIDVSSYNLTLEQLREAMQYVRNTSPDLFKQLFGIFC